MVGKTARALAWIKAVAPNSTGSHYILYHCMRPFKKKKKTSPFYLRMSLMKQYKLPISLNLAPWVLVFEYSVWQNEKHARRIVGYRSIEVGSRKSTYTNVWVASWTLMERFYLKNWQANCSYSELGIGEILSQK